jgi:hypothetical protein
MHGAHPTPQYPDPNAAARTRLATCGHALAGQWGAPSAPHTSRIAPGLFYFLPKSPPRVASAQSALSHSFSL